MSKINDGNISGQRELLRSTIARLIDYIRGYKQKNRAEIAAKLSMLQAELGSADKSAEQDGPEADGGLDAVWRDVACQIAEQKREILVRDQQIKEQEKLLQSRDRQILDQAKEIQSRDQQIIFLQSKLNEINSSVTWRMARKLHRIIDRILPLGSKRRFLAKRILINLAHPGRLIKNLNPINLIRYFRYLNKIGADRLESVVSPAFPTQSAAVIQRRKMDVPDPQKLTSLDKLSAIEFAACTNPLVSIIIPVFNQWQYTYTCLKSIRDNTEGVDYEVIIADDHSTDLTADMLTKIKNIEIVRGDTNLGFIRNCNNASAHARGKYVLFLNNDTIVTKGWLPPLLEVIKREDVGAVGPKLVYPDGSLQEAGVIVWNDGLTWPYGHGDNPELPEYNYMREVDYCTGACLLVKRELFQQLGGFDQRFKPAFYDDPDLCFALRSLGYKFMYQPMSLVVHFEAATYGFEVASRQSEANRQKFVEKWSAILQKYHYSSGPGNRLLARDRGIGHKVLVVDDRVPLYDQGCGYPRAYRMVKALRELGYKVTFFPIGDPFPWQPYTNELQQLGVEVLYGGALDFAEFARARTNYYDVAIVSRPHNMKKALPTIKMFFPDAVLIYDAEALFALREILKAKTNGAPLSEQDADRMMAEEFDLMKGADVVVTVSDVEKRIISEKAGFDKIVVWGHPVEVKEPRTPFSERVDILFVGAFPFKGSPNEDAILYFVREIFPQVQKELACRLFIVGFNPPDTVQRLASPSIIVTGYVKDIRPYYESCRVFIVPHRYSAGIPFKLHEAMSNGIPCVVSALTASQLNLTDGRQVMVATNTAEFAEKIVSLYSDEKLWYQLQQNALDYIRQECHPDVLRATLNHIIDGTLNAPE